MLETIPSKRRLYQVHPVKTLRRNSTTQELAYHEAAHSVIKRLCHVSFVTIAIDQDAGFVGNPDPDTGFTMIKNDDLAFSNVPSLPDPKWLRKPLAMRWACISLAGLQSELLLRNESLPGPIIRKDSDHQRARGLLKQAFNTEQMYYPQLVVRRYLQICWAEVERTAQELLRRQAEYGVGAIQRSNEGDASYFCRECLPIKWLDEHWD